MEWHWIGTQCGSTRCSLPASPMGSSRWRVVLSRDDISGQIANTAPVSSHEKERGAFEFLGGLLGKPASPATAPGRG